MLLSFVGSDHATFLAILPCGTGAGAAVRLCPVVPKILAGSGILVSKHSQISFYMWLVSLVFVIGRTTAFIIDLENAEPWTEIALGLKADGDPRGSVRSGTMLRDAVTVMPQRAGSRWDRRIRCSPCGWPSRF